VQAAARTLGVELKLVSASEVAGIDDGITTFVRQHIDALFVSGDGFFLTHSDQIVALAARHAIAATYGRREAVMLGGLMSYGTDFFDAWRQAGVYAGRVLNGERTSAPVQQVTRLELFINLKTANVLGVNVPIPLLGRADDMLE
jgi:putative ABC transport system substrate-binding protein